jgi:hypothetical protein
MLLLKVFRDPICFGVKCSDFLDYSDLLRAEFQQSGRLQNYITPKPFIISRCVNNCWKDEKHFYIFSFELQVILWIKGHQNLKFVNVVQLGQLQGLLHFTLEL